MREEFFSLLPCDSRLTTTTTVQAPAPTPSSNISNIVSGTGTKQTTKGANDGPDDPRVAKRRGSTEVLDTKKLKTLIIDYPRVGSEVSLSRAGLDASCPLPPGGDIPVGDGGLSLVSENECKDAEVERRFQLRFNVAGFDLESIQVTTDGVRIIVRATKKCEEGEAGRNGGGHGLDGGRHNEERLQYIRKIQKPKEVEHTKLRALLTSDAILIVEAPLPPKVSSRGGEGEPSGAGQERKRKMTGQGGPGGCMVVEGGGVMPHSASRESRDSAVSRASSHDSAKKSPASNSPAAETAGVSKEKIGVPIFRDENGTRKMYLAVELGAVFEAADITVQVSGRG